ncbi:MAG: aminotransferase class V-fold PLP-dependent enzyme [Bacteroidetes bacterium]|jgi:cysteine desulfurase|nr:aminotransferase class V-fold PLP-dependent enzyme [Bacteroidota bacterium]
MKIYLDNAASTPVHPEVQELMVDSLMKDIGNPSSIHDHGRKGKAKIEQARKVVANHFQASLGEIFFTSGGTESNNMALKCSVRDLGVTHILTLPIEHHCVLHSVDRLKKDHPGVSSSFLSVNAEGQINFEELDSTLQNLSDQKVLVSIMHANNEIGTIQDMKTISAICEKHHVYLHSDTVQTVAHHPIDASQTRIHFMTGSAHKFHGPKGVGFLYMNNQAILEPFIDGGAQERNMRAGTENITGIIGMAKALKMAKTRCEEDQIYISKLRTKLKEGLKALNENIRFNGPKDHKSALSTVLNVQFPQHPKSDMFLMYLDLKGISVSGGSACSSGANQGSHVIKAIRGDSEEGMAVRFSFSRYNTAQEIDQVIYAIKEILEW